jgi:hypothetical protein
MVCGHYGYEWVGYIRKRFRVFKLFNSSGAHTNIGVTGSNCTTNRYVAIFAEFHFDEGVQFAEPVYVLGNPIGSYRKVGPDANMTFYACREFVDVSEHAGYGAEKLPGVVHDSLPGRGECHSLGVPIEQQYSQQVFEVVDTLRDGRSGDMLRSRRPADMPLVADRDKQLKSSKIDSAATAAEIACSPPAAP